jgi:predicted RNA binding protein YcfA (HicA-like mRNA interferase family)
MQRTVINLEKIYEADGWYLHRTGKHKVFRHPEKQTISGRPLLLQHGTKEIKIGTWNSALKDAGIDPDKAAELLKK